MGHYCVHSLFDSPHAIITNSTCDVGRYNSYIHSATGNGIRTWKHSAPIVRHNLIHNCGNQALLLVSGHGHYINNRFIAAQGTAGVWVQGRSDAVFTSNVVKCNEGHGFYLGRETKVRLRGNEIYANRGGNVAIYTETAVLRGNQFRPGDLSDRPLYTDGVLFSSSSADDHDGANQIPEDIEIDDEKDPDPQTDDGHASYIRAVDKYKSRMMPAPACKSSSIVHHRTIGHIGSVL